MAFSKGLFKEVSATDEAKIEIDEIFKLIPIYTKYLSELSQLKYSSSIKTTNYRRNWLSCALVCELKIKTEKIDYHILQIADERSLKLLRQSIAATEDLFKQTLDLWKTYKNEIELESKDDQLYITIKDLSKQEKFHQDFNKIFPVTIKKTAEGVIFIDQKYSEHIGPILYQSCEINMSLSL